MAETLLNYQRWAGQDPIWRVVSVPQGIRIESRSSTDLESRDPIDSDDTNSDEWTPRWISEFRVKIFQGSIGCLAVISSLLLIASLSWRHPPYWMDQVRLCLGGFIALSLCILIVAKQFDSRRIFAFAGANSRSFSLSPPRYVWGRAIRAEDGKLLGRLQWTQSSGFHLSARYEWRIRTATKNRYVLRQSKLIGRTSKVWELFDRKTKRLVGVIALHNGITFAIEPGPGNILELEDERIWAALLITLSA